MRITVRPPGREPYAVTIDQLTALVRAARNLRMSALTEKLKTAGAVSKTQREATMAMADRLIAKGEEVAKLRDATETAHMADMTTQMADLQELADELGKMGNGAPPTASEDTVKPEVVGAAPAVNLQQNAWTGTDPYAGTHPDAPAVKS